MTKSVMILCFIHDLCEIRLLGTLSVPLQEVVSRGSQNLSSALKSKKGEVMQVSKCAEKQSS